MPTRVGYYFYIPSAFCSPSTNSDQFWFHSATESKGTVYFEDDFNDAKQATLDTIRAFDDLCASVSSQKRQSLLEANAPKMAQLKQEFKMLEDELIHDE